MMKLCDDRSTTLDKQANLSSYIYITTCGEKIYLTNRDTNTVTCYTIKGDKLWEYKDESVLNNGNVDVTSCNSESVVVIEPDGKQGRQILSSNDGLKNPIGILFDQSKNSLIVANCCGQCFLYQMC